MSEVVIGGSKTPLKRKVEGTENVAPNIAVEKYVDASQAVKKNKSAEMLDSTKTKFSNGDGNASKLRNTSRIARLNTTKSCSSASIPESTLPPTGPTVPTPGKQTSKSGSTPIRQKGESGSGVITSAAACSLIKRLQKRVESRTVENKIRSLFETTFTVNEGSITEIIKKVSKTKSTSGHVSVKEKTQMQVITELRSASKTLLGEINSLRERCASVEAAQNADMTDFHNDITDVIATLNSIGSNETRLKALSEDMVIANAELSHYRSEYEPLKKSNKEMSESLIQLREKLLSEESAKTLAQNTVERYLTELDEMKKSTLLATNSARVQFEQQINQTVAGYKDEVSSLRGDIARKQSDLDRFIDEKSDMERKLNEAVEKLMQAQSDSRYSENKIERIQADFDRVSADLLCCKANLSEKENDLRSQTNLLNELQRQSAEEKGGMKSELCFLQNRVQVLEGERLLTISELAKTKEEINTLNRELKQTADQVDTAHSLLKVKEQECNQLKESSMLLEVERELRARCESREDSERRERIAACAQLMATQTEFNSKVKIYEEKINFQISESEGIIKSLKSDISEKLEENRRQSDAIMGLESEIIQLKLSNQNAQASLESIEQLGRVSGEVEVLRRRLREANESKTLESSVAADKIKELEELIRSGETQRRKMHNVIQELRGNVRVFARVRPFLPNDGVDLSSPPDPSISAAADGVSLRISRVDDDRCEDHAFTFDKVFCPSSSQEAVFQEVSEFVQSALDGFNVCLLSYGQTGSGKTHTMQGSGDGPMRGIIPRAMQQVGQYKSELETQGWEYEMEVSFVEIYNESIRDLLRHGSSHDQKHEIKRDLSGEVFVTDVVKMSVNPNNACEIDNIMEIASRHRSVSATAMNEQSSRSHSVFCLYLKAKNVTNGTTLRGSLSLVDLAGSERLDRSLATGSRAKETMAINKSLSALTDVFVAIGNKQSHIPFRNSKLTYLLQPALSGDGKTLMMVNLSPTAESYYESLFSLRFASQVNQCELGKPKRQVKDITGATVLSASAPKSVAQLSIPKKVAKTR